MCGSDDFLLSVMQGEQKYFFSYSIFWSPLKCPCDKFFREISVGKYAFHVPKIQEQTDFMHEDI